MKIDPVFPSGPILPPPKSTFRRRNQFFKPEVVERAPAREDEAEAWPAEVLVLIGVFALLGLTILFQ